MYRLRLGQKSHQNRAVRFFPAKNKPENRSTVFTAKSAGKNNQNHAGFVQAKKGSCGTICSGQVAVRLITAKNGPEKATKTSNKICDEARKKPSMPGKRIFFGEKWPQRVTKNGPEEVTNTRSTLCSGHEWQICYSQLGPKIAPKTQQHESLMNDLLLFGSRSGAPKPRRTCCCWFVLMPQCDHVRLLFVALVSKWFPIAGLFWLRSSAPMLKRTISM